VLEFLGLPDPPGLHESSLEQALAVFEDYKIRRQYDEQAEAWVFSVVDVVAALIQQPDFQTARKYWNKLKERLKAEGSQTVTNCHQLKMLAGDGKMRLTDVADAKTLLRLIQSVPSPKAEPIKLWLARVGYERIQDMSDPARSLDRARAYWRQHGRSEKWIEQRMMGQQTRNKLTDYWQGHEVKGENEYANLTNIIHQEWSGVSVKQHKGLKGLKTQNLRDHMSEAELIFTALAYLGESIGLTVCDLPLIRVVTEAMGQSWTRDPFDRLITAGAALRKAPLLSKDATILAHYPAACWD